MVETKTQSKQLARAVLCACTQAPIASDIVCAHRRAKHHVEATRADAHACFASELKYTKGREHGSPAPQFSSQVDAPNTVEAEDRSCCKRSHHGSSSQVRLRETSILKTSPSSSTPKPSPSGCFFCSDELILLSPTKPHPPTHPPVLTSAPPCRSLAFLHPTFPPTGLLNHPVPSVELSLAKSLQHTQLPTELTDVKTNKESTCTLPQPADCGTGIHSLRHGGVRADHEKMLLQRHVDDDILWEARALD